MFLWKLARGALTLGTNLQRRGINTSGLCPHCLESETALHLFFTPPLALQIWNLAPFRTTPDFSAAQTTQDAFIIMSHLICYHP
uniref:Reverse transcriptase zinc-binding domain-containing protein n=1 Tax=Brassica campestris TaxID=3711 RepID=A0A3P5XYY6_BRACM|nr:unnamed protein product [Brassica rapa]